ncbi:MULTISPECIES: hypothetical protein [unclassified Streptomyces]|uniref:hypothetical protein n=1 Tax=unclassified Streptomyces TaxID=2593676 RepID=UPI0036ED11F0
MLAVGATLDPVPRATAGLDLAVLDTTTVRPFDEVGLRTAALVVDRADLVLVEPACPGHRPRRSRGRWSMCRHRLLALGGADVKDEEALSRAVRGFLR